MQLSKSHLNLLKQDIINSVKQISNLCSSSFRSWLPSSLTPFPPDSIWVKHCIKFYIPSDLGFVPFSLLPLLTTEKRPRYWCSNAIHRVNNPQFLPKVLLGITGIKGQWTTTLHTHLTSTIFSPVAYAHALKDSNKISHSDYVHFPNQDNANSPECSIHPVYILKSRLTYSPAIK